MSIVNILHLSDLHCMISGNYASTLQGSIIRDLKKTLEKVIETEPINFIVVSGDLSQSGQSDEFSSARDLLSKILKSTKLSQKELIICPGNHDLNRNKTYGLHLPFNCNGEISQDYVNQTLNLSSCGSLEYPFLEFKEFCREFCIPPFKIKDKESYLVGCKEFENVRFIGMNTCWYSDRQGTHEWEEEDQKGMLWAGIGFLHAMNENNQMLHPNDYNNEKFTVAIMHHPFELLHESERMGFSNSFEEYLCKRSHLILMGHSHTFSLFPDSDSAKFVSNSLYGGLKHCNGFTMFTIDTEQKKLVYSVFEHKPCDGIFVMKDRRSRDFPEHEICKVFPINNNGVNEGWSSESI